MTELQASTHPRVYRSAPSTSSASASTDICYNIFINHRGPDVKNTFASHLYHRFLSHGLQPFLDREELQAGDYLTPQIEGAIRTASVHITIFSPRYAESKWCLDELLLILKSGVTIIPVFYNVRPSELRWKGRYTEALNNHEQKGRYDPQTIENWRKALSEVSNLIGFELDAFNGDEGKLCESVVGCALKKCSTKTALHVATYPTGLQEKVEEFEKIVSLQQQSGKAQVLGIVGLGGVGKRTLAKEFFNRKSFEFRKSCFLFDVREIAGRNSLNFLQSKLLKGLTHVDLQLDTVNEGLERLRTSLSFSSALIVLDDVDDVAQLDAFLPLKDVLHPDSVILITSRNRDVLTSSGIAELSIYKLTCLNLQHSRQLFCSHAFCQPYPPPEFHFLVDEFLSVCNGLPLSLKVFGALLCGNNNKSYWEDQLFKLRQIRLPNEILKCLQISYDALNGEERQIFLDIACYFIGEDRDKAIRIWDGSGYKGSEGLLNLQNKCLVNVDRDNKIEMHDHVRDLGRHIADQEMPRRLWRRTSDFEALSQQSRGMTWVRGIRTVDNVLVFSEGSTIRGIITRFKSWSIDVLRKFQIGETKYGFLRSLLSMVKSQNLIWLSLNDCPDSYLPSWIPVKNLRVLDVKGNKFLWREKSQVPMELRELNIYAPLLKFPKTIGQLKHIERITVDCPGIGNLQALPREFCDLRSLKYLQLSRQYSMERLPASFGHLTNLQHLDLSGLMVLSRLPNSFGNLIRLKYLNLRNCINLTMSQETFAYIRTLEYLDLSNCRSIKELPFQVAQQRWMEELHLFRMLHLKELPEDIGNLKNLELLHVGSPLLERLPRSLGQLSSLRQLRLEGCEKLKCLPDSLGMLTQLSTMTVRTCGIHTLPQEILKMNNMVKLSLLWCPLRKLPWQELVEGERETLSDPTGRRSMSELDLSIYSAQHQPCMYRLEYLEILQTEITEIWFPQGVCPNLKHLDIRDCQKLVKVGGLPHKLKTVKLLRCGKLAEIGGLCNLTELQEIKIEVTNEKDLISLEKLNAVLWRGRAEITITRCLPSILEEQLNSDASDSESS